MHVQLDSIAIFAVGGCMGTMSVIMSVYQGVPHHVDYHLMILVRLGVGHVSGKQNHTSRQHVIWDKYVYIVT